jgi:hypothetical protein
VVRCNTYHFAEVVLHEFLQHAGVQGSACLACYQQHMPETQTGRLHLMQHSGLAYSQPSPESLPYTLAALQEVQGCRKMLTLHMFTHSPTHPLASRYLQSIADVQALLSAVALLEQKLTQQQDRTHARALQHGNAPDSLHRACGALC